MQLLKNKRIFVVEDNIANRAIIQLLLEKEGARCAIDRWGLDVIEKLQKFAPVDLIVLDLMFPDGITGYQVFDQIRAVPDFAKTPIVAVSASDPSTAIPETQAHGFAGFISKPVDFQQFGSQISRIIEGEHIWSGMGQV